MKNAQKQTLTCLVTGRTRPTGQTYLEKQASRFGSVEAFKQNYICKEAAKLLREGKTVDEVRSLLSTPATVPTITSEAALAALAYNGKAKVTKAVTKESTTKDIDI